MKSIDQKLVEMKYRYVKRDHLRLAQKDLESKIALEKETLARLSHVVEKEQGDVERLEHISLNRLLASLSGKESLRLEKEKAEAYRAALDYKLKLNDIEFLSYQSNLLKQELKQYEDLDQDTQSLMEIKRKALEPATLSQIREMEETLADWKTLLEHILSTQEQGAKVRSCFTYLLDNLSDLVEDTTEAKSLWYPVISQEEIDDVSGEIAKLNQLWHAFEEQLQTTDISLPEHFNKDFLVKVSDYFSTMEDKRNAMKKINTSFEQLNATYTGLREVLCTLEKRAQELKLCVFDLTMEIREKIEAGI